MVSCLSQLIIVVSIFTVFCEADDSKRDYYEILGIDKSATTNEIKKAFRKLAAAYHPDKNKDPNAKNEFVKIAEAYDILGNEEKRRNYDRFGHDHYTSNPSGGRDFDFNSFFKNFDIFRSSHSHGFGGDSFFSDLFDDRSDEDDGIFGGLFNRQSGGHGSGQHCVTTTFRQGNTVITQTQCS